MSLVLSAGDIAYWIHLSTVLPSEDEKGQTVSLSCHRLKHKWAAVFDQPTMAVSRDARADVHMQGSRRHLALYCRWALRWGCCCGRPWALAAHGAARAGAAMNS